MKKLSVYVSSIALARVVLPLFVMIILTACNTRSKPDKAQLPETPKALQDETSSLEISLKRGSGDMVESLYDELLKNDSNLKDLENKIQWLKESKSDSTEAFDKFNDKNQSYYNAADRRTEGITDSLVRMKIKALLAGSITAYDASVAKHKALLKTIGNKNITITDLYTALKIIRTLPLVEKYQKENLPSPKSLEGYIQKEDEAIRLADSLSKKP